MLTKKLLNQIFDHIDQKHSQLQERVIKHTILKDIVIQSAGYVFVIILQCVARWCLNRNGPHSLEHNHNR